MKEFLKGLLTIFVFGSAFILGYYFGGERLKAKIPNFQENEEEY
ncbi:MAG: hypothetical protein ACE5WD_11115 [Candidatus Aminicenantia bacterium]